ncbi:DUF4177 domain-containing protein [Paracoccus luteus]|uniref:DUF4177 domain-containing protein n=1 Tax=Paracoccus luteus TaxID=2508543 RepID=UPI001FEA1251|nr:DUF4177 domain-containing protein [Paracoccus luteus]
MQSFEYTVIPAPGRGEKVRGAKTGAERFSYALLTEMNRMAANGWEYVRAETLPCEERSGLTSRTTVYHNVLVFRRALTGVQPHHPVTATHDAPPRPQAAAVVPVSAGQTPTGSTAAGQSPAGQSPRPDSEPPAHWPDAAPLPDVDGTAPAATAAAHAAPASPAPRTAGTAARDDRFDEPELPAFVQRPPLAAARDDAARGAASSEPVPPAGATRLGPAAR